MDKVETDDRQSLPTDVMSATKSTTIEWRWSAQWRNWRAVIAGCELVVLELSDGWHAQIDLNVLSSERTTIDDGPHKSDETAKQWAETRLERHAAKEADRMNTILKAFNGGKAPAKT